MRYYSSLSFLLILNLLLRLINLKGLPLYLDEGLYIYWAHLFSLDPANAYISLLDGKTPLFMWLVAWTNPYFHDFLFTARLISSISGVISILCWSQILRLSINRKTSLIFVGLALLTPFLYLLDRMAFVDSTMTAFASVGFLMIFITQHIFTTKPWYLGFVTALISGIFLGFAYLTKSSAQMFLVLSIMTLVYFATIHVFQKKFFLTLLLLLTIPIIYFSQHEITSYLRVGGYRNWSGIVTKENQLTYSLPEVITNLQIDRGHYLLILNYLIDYLYNYLGIFILLSIYSLIIIFKSHRRLTWLVIYSFVATAGIFLSAKSVASRYFYPISFPIIALSSIGLDHLYTFANSNFKIFLKIMMILICIPILFQILLPQNAKYSFDDQSYFLSGDISALGLNESIDYLSKNSSSNVVGIYGIWGVDFGSATLFNERGVDTVILGQWIEQYSRNNLSSCPADQKLLGEFCYKLTIDRLLQNQKPNKYLFLTRENPTQSVALLNQLANIEIIKTFTRPYSYTFSYLIKIK